MGLISNHILPCLSLGSILLEIGIFPVDGVFVVSSRLLFPLYIFFASHLVNVRLVYNILLIVCTGVWYGSSQSEGRSTQSVG